MSLTLPGYRPARRLEQYRSW